MDGNWRERNYKEVERNIVFKGFCVKIFSRREIQKRIQLTTTNVGQVSWSYLI